MSPGPFTSLQRCITVVIAGLLLLVGGPASADEAKLEEKKVTLYYYLRTSAAKGGGKSLGPFTSNNNHPLLDGAIIGVSWPQTHPKRGQFDWSVVDQYLADWTVGGKPLILQLVPYTQIPIAGDPNGDNAVTPQWVYETGVPRITFTSGGAGRGRKVSVPKVWDTAFYTDYEEYVRGLAAKVGGDSRVAGIAIGIGHNGNLTAQPSPNGGPAFQSAGWTLDVWEQHAKRLIDIFAKHFSQKKLFIQVTSIYIRNVMVPQHLEPTKRILKHAAENKVSILFRELDPDVHKFNRTGIRELVGYLSTLNPAPGFMIGLADDWPLWVPEVRSKQCPGPTCGRDVNGFHRELSLALDVWSSINQKIPMFLVFNEQEASATNKNDSRNFNRAVYDVAVAALTGRLEPAPSSTSEQQSQPAPERPRKKRRAPSQ
ncbi:MAG: hypothetical protein HY727_04660 [Candidatus Rokubacteria bacterium]|nr:hypothetical protein [Candidatus Rokubacteria bacterium]